MSDIDFTPELLDAVIGGNCFYSFPLPELTAHIAAGTSLPLDAVQELATPLRLLRRLVRPAGLSLGKQCVIAPQAIQIPIGPSKWAAQLPCAAELVGLDLPTVRERVAKVTKEIIDHSVSISGNDALSSEGLASKIKASGEAECRDESVPADDHSDKKAEAASAATLADHPVEAEATGDEFLVKAKLAQDFLASLASRNLEVHFTGSDLEPTVSISPTSALRERSTEAEEVTSFTITARVTGRDDELQLIFLDAKYSLPINDLLAQGIRSLEFGNLVTVNVFQAGGREIRYRRLAVATFVDDFV